MSFKPRLSKFPERERRQMLEKFLAVLDRDPSLAHFRTIVRTRPERQLALFAAFERAVVVGSPTAAPPGPDDEADQILCDILDCVDRHPDLKNGGSVYGPDRHLANLQVLGLWRNRTPLTTPTARELFATAFSRLTADPATPWPSSDANNSPPAPVFGSSGELIDPSHDQQAPLPESSPSPQTVNGVLVMSIAPGQEVAVTEADSPGIIRHATPTPGEQCDADLTDPRTIPARPLRRPPRSHARIHAPRASARPHRPHLTDCATVQKPHAGCSKNGIRICSPGDGLASLL
jgi:hypothetical protein